MELSQFEGKVILVVNTATGCGFTPQYDELQDIYEELHDEGLEILDFPCNQFGEQAPGDDEEIHDFCTGRYGITFPQYSKIHVNGENAIPLYKWITTNTKFAGFKKILREKAVEIPAKIGACIDIEPEEAMQLYQILNKILNKN